MKRALVALWLVGCAPDLTNLDCASNDDQTCPTGYWCQEHGTAFSTCADISRVPVPDLTLDGIGSAATPQGTTVTLSSATNNTVFVRVKNLSSRDAQTLSVVVTAPLCTGLDGTGINIVDPVAAGGTYEDAISFVKPDVGCPSPSSAKVFFTTEGKQFNSPFQVVVTP